MLSLRPLPAQTKMSDLSTLLATWFGSGLIRPASGTWGSLASLPFVSFIVFFLPEPYNLYTLLGFILMTFMVGLWASTEYMKISNTHDASEIVIDETCGLAITFLGLFYVQDFVDINYLLSTLVLFVLFRFYDAVKPFPISYLDRSVTGSLGVMIDDCAAGIFASLTFIGGIMLWAHLV